MFVVVALATLSKAKALDSNKAKALDSNKAKALDSNKAKVDKSGPSCRIDR